MMASSPSSQRATAAFPSGPVVSGGAPPWTGGRQQLPAGRLGSAGLLSLEPAGDGGLPFRPAVSGGLPPSPLVRRAMAAPCAGAAGQR